ncbi:AAA family ATPase [Aliifodinibius sp. S!AR15-10]|uniref:bifunctional aminoglycoside phosphotransferase/ATP-binding protein n=1 Tax=Aliifodinibius sp. S!AR15-10 TaxID=2950437 RepID=UPI0028670016|nr:AAA family ATPase [Aliifodinibius sp. S!AR15-10]MDR8393274.1 AAA family ATPase [Aliifodinibius sp. S!AR15-10]
MRLSDDQYSRLIHFLEQPDSYSHQPEQVKHLQTHISHVFIADPYVYKIKKTVDLEFLDYSTLQKRKKFCQREVELNRRLTDDIYLGVVPITLHDNQFGLEEGEHSTVVEYAVKMNRLPEEYFLHSLIQNESLTTTHLDRVVDKLASFYGEQDPSPEVLEYGAVEKIKYNTDENFRQTKPFSDEIIDRASYNAIKAYTNGYFEQNTGLFKHRIEEKRIVDGHGDLHLDHIHITPQKVQIYDCIEFNERFRYGDLAVDLAFLAMDLDFNGRWKEERYFVEQMAAKLGDADLHRMINFYKCYRAYVKGKVKSLQSTEQEVAKEDRKQAEETARRYFDLSLRYATLGSKPMACIFMGRIGSGKSTLAGNLAEKMSIDYYSSDYVRKSMAGLPIYERTPASEREELYSPEMSDKTYEELHNRALQKLNQGESVILDATFSNQEGRQEWMKLLEAQQFEYLFVETEASDETIKERLKQRDNGSEIVSDARLEDFEELDQNYQPPIEIHPSNHIRVNTEQPVNNTLQELYLKLVERRLEQ